MSFHPNGTTLSLVAERRLVDRPKVTGSIQRLLQKEFIFTTHNPNDKRSHLILLTEKTKNLSIISTRSSFLFLFIVWVFLPIPPFRGDGQKNPV
ncbi:MarR family transcriptional regulator [Bacillus sp. S10(2024)]|uniref:MarR family transcriptional regulator n=1 Tax=Bacillus sp. S10(2024) TaxID=3162886 RepID=UPI003D204375